MSPLRLLKRICTIGLLLSLAACDLPMPVITFATQGPPPPPTQTAPTATPPPSSIVTFTVRLPANTPAGSSPAVKIIDSIGGADVTVPLLNTSANVWSGGTQAILGDVLRYKYIRMPTAVEEVTADRQPVSYRLFAVTQTSPTADDTVAAWADTPFSGDLGGVEGAVWNSNTGQGAPGVLVSAGGQLAVTGWNGNFQFLNLPVGAQRVTCLMPDGSLRPVQDTAAVVKDQMKLLDIVSGSPKAVRLTFVVRLPPGTESVAPPRLVGNTAQLGDTFMPGTNSSTIAAARQPALAPLTDGRWAVNVTLYEGMLLRYKYTLGDGVWNGELNASGTQRLRQLVVPPGDATLVDSVESWHSGASASVAFEATTPPATAPNDTLAIQFRTQTWNAPVPMWRTGINTWKFVLYNPENFSGNVFYRYCRNFACGTADDSATAGPNATGRFFSPTLLPQELKDTISYWQWLPTTSATPIPFVMPVVTPTLNFTASIDFADTWRPNWLAVYPETLRAIQATGANWVTFTRRGKAQPLSPTPVFADDLALAPSQNDWNTLVSQTHAAGLRVALHPVTCHYTPYGECEYWPGITGAAGFWDRWFWAYQNYMINEAELAARSGVDLLVIGDFKLRPSFPGEPEAPPDAEVRWRNLIQNIRAHYKGPLAFELLMGQSVWPAPPKFLDAIDVIRLYWWSPLSAGASTPANEMAANAGRLLDTHLLPLQQQFKKPLVISAAYYSADGAATQCLKRDDGQCYAYEAFNADSPDIPRYALDLQEQADIYNALLTAVNGRGWISGFAAYGYNPATTLLDKSISVRGKPAEMILSAWYPRLQKR